MPCTATGIAPRRNSRPCFWTRAVGAESPFRGEAGKRFTDRSGKYAHQDVKRGRRRRHKRPKSREETPKEGMAARGLLPMCDLSQITSFVNSSIFVRPAARVKPPRTRKMTDQGKIERIKRPLALPQAAQVKGGNAQRGQVRQQTYRIATISMCGAQKQEAYPIFFCVAAAWVPGDPRFKRRREGNRRRWGGRFCRRSEGNFSACGPARSLAVAAEASPGDWRDRPPVALKR